MLSVAYVIISPLTRRKTCDNLHLSVPFFAFLDEWLPLFAASREAEQQWVLCKILCTAGEEEDLDWLKCYTPPLSPPP